MSFRRHNPGFVHRIAREEPPLTLSALSCPRNVRTQESNNIKNGTSGENGLCRPSSPKPFVAQAPRLRVQPGRLHHKTSLEVWFRTRSDEKSNIRYPRSTICVNLRDLWADPGGWPGIQNSKLRIRNSAVRPSAAIEDRSPVEPAAETDKTHEVARFGATLLEGLVVVPAVVLP